MWSPCDVQFMSHSQSPTYEIIYDNHHMIVTKTLTDNKRTILHLTIGIVHMTIKCE